MKRMITAVIAAMMIGWVDSADAVEASVSVDMASAYVFRGTTFNDGLVVQPALEVAGDALTLGVWGNLDVDDYDGALLENEFSEVDLYGVYSLPVEAVDLSIGYTEYTYPGAAGDADREVSVSVALDALLSPSLGLFYGVDGGIEKSLYVELGLSHEVALTEDIGMDLGVTLGYANPDEGEAGFSHFTTSLGLSYACVSAGVTYIGQIDDDVLPDGAGSYDADVVGTVGVGWDL